jgi:hypothetical protein
VVAIRGCNLATEGADACLILAYATAVAARLLRSLFRRSGQAGPAHPGGRDVLPSVATAARHPPGVNARCGPRPPESGLQVNGPVSAKAPDTGYPVQRYPRALEAIASVAG